MSLCLQSVFAKPKVLSNMSWDWCRSVVMVPDVELDKSLTKQADLVLPSLLDFDPAVWGLPPFAEQS